MALPSSQKSSQEVLLRLKMAALLKKEATKSSPDRSLMTARLSLQILRLLDNEAIEAEELGEVQSAVADYLDRNQEDFDFFACPDDAYEEVLEQLDNLEVCSSRSRTFHAK